MKINSEEIKKPPLKRKGRGNQKTAIKNYCEGVIDLEVASKICSLIDESKDLMTKEDYKRLGFQPNKIRVELNNLKSQDIIASEVKKKFLPGFHQSKDIKVQLSHLYNSLGIDKKAKASDIETVFNVEPIRKSIEGKTVVGYLID